MLPWEIGANESDETTKAFAVLTRTAPLSGSKPAHLERGFDVCTGTCCQIYRGLARTDARLERLADETASEVRPTRAVRRRSPHDQRRRDLLSGGVGRRRPALPALGRYRRAFTRKRPTAYGRNTSRCASCPSGCAYGGVFAALTGAVTELRVTATDCYGSGFVTELTAADSEGNTAVLRYSAPIRQALGLKSANFTLTPVMLRRPNGKRLPGRRAHRRKRPRPRRGTQRHGAAY